MRYSAYYNPIMNLRKKKEKLDYHNPQFLSRNFDYEELTKGRHRRQMETSDSHDKERITHIFEEIMDSIRKNIQQSKMKQNPPESEEEEEEGEKVDQEQEQEGAGRYGTIKKRVKIEQYIKEIRDFKKQSSRRHTKDRHRKVYRFKNHTPAELKSIVTDPSKESKDSLPQGTFTFKDAMVGPLSYHYPLPNAAFSLFNPHAPCNSFFMSGYDQQAPSADFKTTADTINLCHSKPRAGQKLFNRSSFHVAIAYYIHLKEKQFCKDPLEIDPTYPAKKLRKLTPD